jgi:hypothetical protein
VVFFGLEGHRVVGRVALVRLRQQACPRLNRPVLALKLVYSCGLSREFCAMPTLERVTSETFSAVLFGSSVRYNLLSSSDRFLALDTGKLR